MKYLAGFIIILSIVVMIGFRVQDAQANNSIFYQSVDAPAIIGGQEADIGEYPWQAVMQTSDSNGDTYLCGGSLIKTDWLLTAAHCVYDDQSNSLLTVDIVILGAHDITQGGEAGRQSFTAKQVIVHANYNPNNLTNDIALIELNGNATLNSYVGLIDLASASGDDDLYQAGTQAVVSGWGQTGDSSGVSDVLMEVTVPIVSQATCQSAYGGYVTGNMVCAGYNTGGKDSCRGDSGGPLIAPDAGSNWKQVGIVSWGHYPCAEAGYYGVYTRVSKYYNWVMEQVGGGNLETSTPTPIPQPTHTLQPTNTPISAVTPTATATKTHTPIPPPTSTPVASPTAVENLMDNGDFESGGASHWETSSLQSRQVISNELPVAAASGEYVAWLGGVNNEESRLWQAVPLPSNGALYLVFDYAVLSDEQGCFRDVAKIYLAAQRIKQYVLCNDTATLDWRHEVLNIQEFAGQRLNLQFFTRNNRSDASSFFVDNIKVTNTLRSGESASSIVAVSDGDAGEPGAEVFPATDTIFLPIIAK